MNVYFARSLRGARAAGSNQLYKDIVDAIKAAGHRTQFEIPVTDIVRTTGHDIKENEMYIYRRDLYWIDNCQAMIAEVTSPSHGVGYEIAYAKHVRKIPIFCCCQKDTIVSAMISGDLGVLQYRDIGDLSGFIGSFLEGISV